MANDVQKVQETKWYNKAARNQNNNFSYMSE